MFGQLQNEEDGGEAQKDKQWSQPSKWFSELGVPLGISDHPFANHSVPVCRSPDPNDKERNGTRNLEHIQCGHGLD
jgi:hypothetical protein